MTQDSSHNAAQPSVYRLVVRSADEAVSTIRERFGAAAKVLSVKQLEGQGLMGLLSRPKLEVLVQVETPGSQLAPETPAAAPSIDLQSATSETPPDESQLSPTEFLPNTARVVAVPGSRRGAPTNLPSHDLPDLLRKAGFSETFMNTLTSLPSWAQHYDRPLHASFADLGRELRKRLENRKMKPLPLRSAFLGTRGVGRTTALCKLLGSEVFARGRTGRVLKVEFDQPNPAENLGVYCEALGLGMEHYLPGLSPETPQGCFLYADLPGFDTRRPELNKPISDFIKSWNIEGRVLVLNALYDVQSLRSAYSAGRDLGATHLVFTHCDEVQKWGKLMDFLLDGEITPLFLATGPSLSGDCLEDAVGAVLRKTIPGA
jgi:flagellar biosynthesis protein FlhF